MLTVHAMSSAGRAADYYGKDDYYVTGDADAPGLEWKGTVEDASVMVTNADWIPIETGADKLLIDTLIGDGRRFSRGLRYNLPAGRPLATAVLSDTGDIPTALYIMPASASADQKGAMEELIEHSRLPSWVWKEGEARPALPLKAVYRPAAPR